MADKDYEIVIKADTRQLRDELMKGRKAVQALSKGSEKSIGILNERLKKGVIDIKQYNASLKKIALNKLNKQFKEGSIDANNYAIKLKQLQNANKPLATSIKKVNKRLKENDGALKTSSIAMGAFLGSIAANVVSRAVSGLFEIGATALRVAQDMEVLETQFTVLTGNAETAQKVLKDLKEFAASTPFQIEGLAQATKQLIQAKVAQEDLIPTLKQIGDIAAVTGVSIEQLAVPFARLKSRGSLTLEELQKFDDVGAGLINTLAEMNGMSIAQLRKDISAGKIPFEDLEKAIAKVTSTGGQFADGMLKQSATLSGKISTLGDNWDQFLGNLAAGNSGVMKDTVDLFISMIGSVDRLNKANKAYAENTDVLTFSTEQLREELETLKERQDAGGIFWNEKEAARMHEVNALLLEQAGAFTTLQGIMSGSFQSKEIMSTPTISGGEDDVPTPKVVALTPEQIQAAEAEKKFIADKNESIREIQLAHFAQMDEATREAQGFATEQDALDFETLMENVGAKNAVELQMLQDKIDAETNIRKKAKMMQELEAKTELKTAQNLKKKKDKNDKDTEALELKGKANFFNDLSILSKTGSRELFEINKLANIARITTGIPATISSAYQAGSSIGGPPVGAAFGAVAGAAQLALLSQTMNSQPAFAGGGILNAGGSSITGDTNSARFNDREMFLNMRQQSTLFSAIDSGAIGGGGGLSTELLAELVEIQRTRTNDVSINGEKLNTELQDLNSRRL